MKKYILLFITAILISGIATSQCTPDAKYTAPGFYSSAGLNKLPNAIIGVAYDEVVTFVIPKDTSGITIDSAVLVSLTGLPTGITYNLLSSTVLGGTSGCARIAGKTLGSPGPKTINISVLLYLKGAPAALSYPGQFDMIVDWPASTTENEFDFNKVKIAPNPVRGKATFQLNNKTTGEVEISVHNLLGEKVFNTIQLVYKNDAKIVFDANDLPSGIYTYTISFNGQNNIGRIIIAEK